MDNQRDIHYRVGGKLTHCGVECLPHGKDIERIIIARIEYKDSEKINGREEKGVWVAHFAQNPYTNLPFILNSTNRKRLVKLYPDCEGYLARLENVAVRLTKEETRDVQDGGTTWGLRISKIPAAEASSQPEKQQTKKVITADKVDAVVKWAIDNGQTFEGIAKMCDFENDTVKNAIADALSAPNEDLP